jgi:hypothetical protein
MPTPSAKTDRWPRPISSSLGRELIWVLLLKVILLAGIWFLFFRHDPNAIRPSVDDALFVKADNTTTPCSHTPKEISHDIR